MVKLFKLFLLIALLAPLSSCSDDKDDPKNPEELSIVGVWRLDFGSGYQMLTYEQDGKYSLVEIDYAASNWSEQGIYTIKDNIITRYNLSVPEDDSEYKSVYTILSHSKTKLITRYEGSYVGEEYPYYDDAYEEWTRVE